MATARSKLIDSEHALHYHLTSRCVRRSFLCGDDPETGHNYDHRKAWIEDRMRHLAQSFALQIDAYAIMSNHFHLVVYYDPKACHDWSDAEVADRWTAAFPPHKHGQVDELARAVRRESIALNPDLAASRRSDLGSVSMFMKYLKQPIALKANQEDGCDGHFWEQRFYSGAILDEAGVLAAMAYVDLNPVRARIAQTIEASEHTSVHRRLKGFENSAKRLKKAIRPVVSGLGQRSYRFSLTVEAYLDLLRSQIPRSRHANRTDADLWARRIASIGKTQRAYGSQSALTQWHHRQKLRPLASPLPE